MQSVPLQRTRLISAASAWWGRALPLMAICAGSIAVGALLVVQPVLLLVLVAAIAVFIACLRLESPRLIVLSTLAALLPLHLLMLNLGFPPWWKEALVLLTLVFCIPRFQEIVRGPVTWGIVLFAVCVMVSALIKGRLGLYDIGPYLAYAPLAISLPVLIRSYRELKRLTQIAAISLSLNACAVILARIQNREIIDTPALQSGFQGQIRPGSFAGANLATALVLGAAAGVALAVLLLSRRRLSLGAELKRFVPFALFLVAAVMTLARSALVPAALTMIVVPLVVLSKKKARTSPIIAVAALLGVVTLALVLFRPSEESLVLQRFRLAQGANAASDVNRLERWRSAIELVKEEPLIGHGPGYTGLSRIFEFLGPDPKYFPDDLPVPIAESDWLKIAAELGIAGASLAVLLTLLTVRSLWRKSEESELSLLLLVIFLATVLGGAVRPSMETYLTGAFFWSLVGLSQLRFLEGADGDRPEATPTSSNLSAGPRRPPRL